jgi:hypothetical protein
MERYANGAVRLLKGGLLLLAACALISCQSGILFEETNADPHPPMIRNFQYSPSSIVSGETIRGSFTYVDSGADIEELSMRDTSGTNPADPSPFVPGVSDVICGPEEECEEPPNVFFFPGTSGTTQWEMKLESNQPGMHTIKVWLVDSKDSWSGFVYFDVFISI